MQDIESLTSNHKEIKINQQLLHFNFIFFRVNKVWQTNKFQMLLSLLYFSPDRGNLDNWFMCLGYSPLKCFFI